MSCLTDFIGLRGCSNAEPLSGLWIDDYPGISTELLDKVASQDQVTYLGVWQSVQRQAYQKFKTEVQKYLREYANARLDQVLFQTAKPFVQQWSQVQTGPAQAIYKGVLASISGGKYLGIRVKHAYVYNAAEEPKNITIKYFQTQDCVLLYEKEATVQPGMNQIPINQVFYTQYDKLNVAQLVDCSDLPTLTGTFVDYGWNWLNMECQTRWSYWFYNGINNFPITAPLDYGLGVDFNQQVQSGIYWDAELLCSLDALICSQKFDLIDAWGRLLCAEILRTKLATQRFNYFAQSNRDITNQNMSTFLEEFRQAMQGWANQLNLDRENLCFDCDDSYVIRQKNRMP